MNTTFYIAAAVAVLSTLLVIVSRRAVHALLYFIVSLLAVAVMFYVMGAPFVAMLQVIIYAGAIMVLFLFVLMMINLSADVRGPEQAWLKLSRLAGPALLAAVLVGELLYVLGTSHLRGGGAVEITPAQVGAATFGPYVLGAELASLLLLAGLVGTYHLARRRHVPGSPKEEMP